VIHRLNRQRMRRHAAISFAIATGVIVVTLNQSLCAAPMVVNGATFDAPPNCQAIEDALVCKDDEQQFELSVHRQPIASRVDPGAPFVRKMAYVQTLHDAVVKNIVVQTASDNANEFSTYGKYSVIGSAMAGKGTVAAPSARFVSLLQGDEVWQLLEIVAVRSPKIEALSSALAQSLALSAPKNSADAGATGNPTNVALANPAPSSAASETPVNNPAATSTAANAPAANANASGGTNASAVAAPTTAFATPSAASATSSPSGALSTATPAFKSTLLSLQHPDYLMPDVSEDSKDGLHVTFKHKRRTGGPNLSIKLLTPKDAQQSAASVARERRAQVNGWMRNPGTLIDVNKFGGMTGSGFAIVGVLDAKQGLSGLDSFECTFAADVDGKVLEITLTADQKYSEDAEYVWSLLAKTLLFAH
jgi:hypothetical protein